jgi:hypothetical protein
MASWIVSPETIPATCFFRLGHPFTLVTGRVSVRFEIPCVLLHFAALRLMAKPLCLQDNATRCAHVRRWWMRSRVSCSVN